MQEFGREALVKLGIEVGVVHVVLVDEGEEAVQGQQRDDTA